MFLYRANDNHMQRFQFTQKTRCESIEIPHRGCRKVAHGATPAWPRTPVRTLAGRIRRHDHENRSLIQHFKAQITYSSPLHSSTANEQVFYQIFLVQGRVQCLQCTAPPPTRGAGCSASGRSAPHPPRAAHLRAASTPFSCAQRATTFCLRGN